MNYDFPSMEPRLDDVMEFPHETMGLCIRGTKMAACDVYGSYFVGSTHERKMKPIGGKEFSEELFTGMIYIHIFFFCLMSISRFWCQLDDHEPGL
jgi:hypothetical protein